MQIGGCVGLAACPQHGFERSSLMKNADLALYSAKSMREQPVRVFEPKMAATLREREALEADLRTAVAHERLEVYFQPQLRIATMEIVGFEALLRWTEPGRGPISPDVFITLAEEIGLIIPLGRYVLEKSCSAATAWPGAARVAVNISPVQFHDAGLPSMVAEILASTGLAPERLELEVTESVVIGNETQALKILTTLQALGIKIALDDFGTGYASLATLLKYPFDRIKVDKSFVQVANP